MRNKARVESFQLLVAQAASPPDRIALHAAATDGLGCFWQRRNQRHVALRFLEYAPGFATLRIGLQVESCNFKLEMPISW